MLCDVCNATVDSNAPRVSADTFRLLLDCGFGLNETNVQMVMDGGVPRAEAIARLTAAYKTSQSDWVLCDVCFQKAKSNITS